MNADDPVKVIELPGLGRPRIELRCPDRNVLGQFRRGRITTTWRNLTLGDVDDVDDLILDSAVRGVQTLVLRHAMAGLDVTMPAYVIGLRAYITSLVSEDLLDELEQAPNDDPCIEISD